VSFVVLAPGCQSGNFWIHPCISSAKRASWTLRVWCI